MESRSEERTGGNIALTCDALNKEEGGEEDGSRSGERTGGNIALTCDAPDKEEGDGEDGKQERREDRGKHRPDVRCTEQRGRGRRWMVAGAERGLGETSP